MDKKKEETELPMEGIVSNFTANTIPLAAAQIVSVFAEVCPLTFEKNKLVMSATDYLKLLFDQEIKHLKKEAKGG